MTTPDQDRWLRVKERLRAEVGEDIFQSWFARMDLERVDGAAACLSVPTRFLKSWIQSHYTDRVLACWQSEHDEILKFDVSVRCAVI
jgi:chromosomal replication initiator protein